MCAGNKGFFYSAIIAKLEFLVNVNLVVFSVGAMSCFCTRQSKNISQKVLGNPHVSYLK